MQVYVILVVPIVKASWTFHLVINSSVFMTAACSHWTEWSVSVTCTAMPCVYLAYRSFVFHQPCLEGSSCLPHVEGATFTWNTVDNTLHVMFVWLSFDHHQSNGNRLSHSTSFPLCCLLVILLLPVLLSVYFYPLNTHVTIVTFHNHDVTCRYIYRSHFVSLH